MDPQRDSPELIRALGDRPGLRRIANIVGVAAPIAATAAAGIIASAGPAVLTFLLGGGIAAFGTGMAAAWGRPSREAAAGAAAERDVLKALSGLDNRHALLANRLVPTPSGEYRPREVDALVARADGVYVIEVKRCADPVVAQPAVGRWWRVDARGERRSMPDPVQQVQGQGRAVRRHLMRHRIEVPVVPMVVVLAPQFLIDASTHVPIVGRPQQAKALIESQPLAGGQGGDPRGPLQALPRRGTAVR